MWAMLSYVQRAGCTPCLIAAFSAGPAPTLSRPSRLLLLLGAHGRGDRVEYAVHERRGVLAAEPSRDVDRLVDRHRRGDLRALQELKGGEPQQVQIDAGQPREPPVLGTV